MWRASRLAKLRAMSAGELAGRLRYRGYLEYERRLHQKGRLAPGDRLRRALNTDTAHDARWQELLLRRTHAGSFFAGVATADLSALRHAYPDELGKAREVAGCIARHEIGFFGERFSLGPRIAWHADPRSRAVWPRTFHADVPIHGGDRGYGDVKYVWELNRHQFLVDLAKVAFVDGSETHRHAAEDLVRHWLEEVPYATGAPWACALEPAFRAWSWIWTYHLLKASHPLDDDFHLAWLTGFYDHGRFLHRHLETYTSPYNHLVGEASALFALGLLFPEFKESAAWAARGRAVLESTLPSQFHGDGGTVEQSTFYHHATLGFYILSALLARVNGCDVSHEVWQAIERGIAFSVSLAQPDGRVPRIGGADDGKPIRLEHLPFYDFRPYYAIGAVLFDRADFKCAAGRFWEDAHWILGASGAERFSAIGSEPPPVAAAMQESGYYVARSGWSRDADYLCFDCGPQAGGLRRDDIPSAAHGHADCLSVIVVLGGREVLVDPGFFCYNGDPEWEVHFRRTRAHNTIVVDDTDQAHHISKMAWTQTYEPMMEAWSASGALAWMCGSHDGYARGPSPVVHRRLAWLRPGGYVILYDELAGAGGRQFDVIFQFAPGRVQLADGRGSVGFDDRFDVAWAATVPVEPAISCGGDTPAAGWVAPSLGVRVPAPRVCLRGVTGRNRTIVLTVITDRTRRAPASACEVSLCGSDRLLRATVSSDGWEDEVMASATGGPVAVPGIQTDASVVVLSRRDGRIHGVEQAGGRLARVTGVP